MRIEVISSLKVWCAINSNVNGIEHRHSVCKRLQPQRPPNLPLAIGCTPAAGQLPRVDDHTGMRPKNNFEMRGR